MFKDVTLLGLTRFLQILLFYSTVWFSDVFRSYTSVILGANGAMLTLNSFTLLKQCLISISEQVLFFLFRLFREMLSGMH